MQPNYVPWKGYFHFIDAVDVFILLDTDRYKPCNWRNRNRIKTAAGSRWLTIPVRHKGFSTRPTIKDTEVSVTDWVDRHLDILFQAYRKAPRFDQASAFVERLYRSITDDTLGAINHHLLGGICDYLGISTSIRQASTMEDTGERISRLISLCHQAGGTHYISPPNARSYLEPHLDEFLRAGLEVSFFLYPDFPTYSQVHPPFDHRVTVLDPIFHAASGAGRLLTKNRNSESVPG